MTENLPSNSSHTEEPSNPAANTVDEITRSRCGALSAHGLSDIQIAGALMMTIEQVSACHHTEEFKKKYAEEADAAIQAQIDRDEGWDAVETEGLRQVLETLKYNRDPKYALSAAMLANKAERGRRKQGAEPHVIDNSKTTNNVIVLNLNKNYVAKSTQNESGMIDVSPRPAQIPLKSTDIPSPKLVEELLAPVQHEKKTQLSELEQAFKDSGVVFDSNE